MAPQMIGPMPPIYHYAAVARFLNETYGGLTAEDIARQYPKETFRITHPNLISKFDRPRSLVPPVLLAMQKAPPSKAIATPRMQWQNPILLFNGGRFTYFTIFAHLPTEYVHSRSIYLLILTLRKL
jgi:hypothetical protein